MLTPNGALLCDVPPLNLADARRKSWSAENLYNIHLRTSGPLRKDLTFTKSSKTLFQQQWFAKKLVRGYHGDWIQEGKFQKAFLPLNIPPIIGSQSPSTSQLQKGKSAQPVAQREEGRGGQKVPLGSLMFREVERRLDVLVFRACFAPSAYAAKMMVVTGQVSLNGIKVSLTVSHLAVRKFSDSPRLTGNQP